MKRIPNGFGTLYLKDNVVWTGEFKDGKIWNGNGIRFGKGGKVSYEGEIKNGKEWTGKGNFQWSENKFNWDCQGIKIFYFYFLFLLFFSFLFSFSFF